ncbi:DUF927 domain-containing protein [Sabulicella glaciei]|uniref:DUF927 domain-containing protein n=1 Tax=Sabulicella glaciei TaxID=2984948 RepID=A0ABT3P0U9_9PROT|nr:DUF927 domain-containing protein [Roseococcus sp. MDT2-1-1]MCW8088039.1 DUF927 domain-containing protein [Roseococcus sp. MDT2-1-1]
MLQPQDRFAPLGNGELARNPGETRSSEWRSVLPAIAPLPSALRHPGHGVPSRVWHYWDAGGALLFAVARFDRPGSARKEVLPYCCGADGRWKWKAPPEPRPLYGLRALAERPDAPVIVVEGEKAAAAAAKLFPSHVAVTWQGGSAAVGKADWSPLRGRSVCVWPDADTGGQKATRAICKALLGPGGASALAVVDVPADWPNGWDVADEPPAGVSAAALRDMLAAAEPVAISARNDAEAVAIPRGFVMKRDGVWCEPDPNAEGHATLAPTFVCEPLRVVAMTNDGQGQRWGRLLQWEDADGRPHEWAMPNAMLSGDGMEMRSRLLDGGLHLGTGHHARGKLSEYLLRSRPRERVLVVERIGWHRAGDGRRVFVLPDRTLPAAGTVAELHMMLQTLRPDLLPPLRRAGTLADWQDCVARHAAGNSRLAFAICAAFAPPLLGLLEAEGGGFHLRGGSSIGKTTALDAAGSVWGGGGLNGWRRSWRTTGNGAEAVAANHSDLLLCLDEMGEADPETVAAAAYMLANGAGKARAGRDGSARRPAEWRLLFLSTGEEGLAARLAEARGGPKRVRAGQEVRILDVPADTGVHGLLESLHGFATAAELIDEVKAGTARCYGTAGLAWLEALTHDLDGMVARAREVIAAVKKRAVPVGADGQVVRAAHRFALVAAAGELATGAGVLPWEPDEASRAALACFKAWRAARAGGDGPAEAAAAVDAVRHFIELHGQSRFVALSEAEGSEARNVDKRAAVMSRAGWCKRDKDGTPRYLIFPQVWARDVVPGHDPEAAARAVLKAGFLIAQGSGRLQRAERVPGEAGSLRFYVVRGTILAGEEGTK